MAFSTSWSKPASQSLLRPLDPQVAAIVEARHRGPFSYLGMHRCAAGVCVRAILPDAQEMAVLDATTGEIVAKGDRVHPDGLFVATIADRKQPFRYRLRVLSGGVRQEIYDIY